MLGCLQPGTAGSQGRLGKPLGESGGFQPPLRNRPFSCQCPEHGQEPQQSGHPQQDVQRLMARYSSQQIRGNQSSWLSSLLHYLRLNFRLRGGVGQLRQALQSFEGSAPPKSLTAAPANSKETLRRAALAFGGQIKEDFLKKGEERSRGGPLEVRCLVRLSLHLSLGLGGDFCPPFWDSMSKPRGIWGRGGCPLASHSLVG